MSAVMVVGLVWAAAWAAAPRAEQARGPQEVIVDVVVLDRDNRPVVGLRPEDFRVREDGRDVKVTAFRAVTPTEAAARGQGRSAVLVLDDVGLVQEQTTDAQKVAERLLNQASPTDSVGVVRFSQRGDEIAGPRSAMAMRIAEFVGGARPFREPDSFYEAMQMIAALSSELVRLGGEPRRHAIIWIGSPELVDIRKPDELQYSQIWPWWIQAVMATSRAHASLYVIHPQGGRRFDPDGIPVQTGGTVSEVRDVMAGADRIWNEIGYYYLLTYAPPRTGREFYQTDVRVSRPDVRVRARRGRG
jgi:VWFA-related protein